MPSSRVVWVLPLAVVVASCTQLTAFVAQDAVTHADRAAAAATVASAPTLEPTPDRTAVPSDEPARVQSATSPPVQSPTPTPAPAATPTPTPTPVPLGGAPTGATETATVLRIVDGDTIEVDRGRGPEKVRYIGIDTPETVHPAQPVEWMGQEASAANAGLVEGREVVLESDVTDTDQYGRLLRYVWTENAGGWIFVNLALLAKGYAQVSTYPPDVKYVDLYLVRQGAARDEGLGLWGTPPAATPVPPSDATAAPLAQGGNCDASYPGVCIPPAPPDLDCGDIEHRRFEVIAPDPHGFDGNSDGVGCESG